MHHRFLVFQPFWSFKFIQCWPPFSQARSEVFLCFLLRLGVNTLDIEVTNKKFTQLQTSLYIAFQTCPNTKEIVTKETTKLIRTAEKNLEGLLAASMALPVKVFFFVLGAFFNDPLAFIPNQKNLPTWVICSSNRIIAHAFFSGLNKCLKTTPPWQRHFWGGDPWPFKRLSDLQIGDEKVTAWITWYIGVVLFQ